MLKKGITVRKANLSDAHGLASVISRSFQDSPWVRLRNALAQNFSPEERESLSKTYYRRRVEQMGHQLSDPTFITRVAMYDGRVAGCAVWIIRLGSKKPQPLARFIRTLSLRERLLGVYLAAALFVRSWLPRSLERWIWNVSKQERTIREKTRGVLERRREAIKRCLPREASETDYLILNSLNVLPEYERKGIGKTLMQQGLDMANEDKVAIYLAASPAGKGLYERMGFEVLEENEVGYQDIHTWKETIMRYQPM